MDFLVLESNIVHLNTQKYPLFLLYIKIIKNILLLIYIDFDYAIKVLLTKQLGKIS